MAFDISGFSSTYKVPRFAAQLVFAAGVIGAGSLGLPILCIGMKTSSGSMTADSDVQLITSYEDADTYCGAGSQAARMLYKALDYGGDQPIYVACPAEPSGVKATATMVFAFSSGTTTAAAGTMVIYIAGEALAIDIPAGQTKAQIAAAVTTAVATRPRWPVTAADDSTDTSTLTCTNKGTSGMDWILYVDWSSMSGTNATVTVAGSSTIRTNMVRLGATAGTGVEDYTTILTKLTTRRYGLIACGANGEATVDNLTKVKNQLATLAGPTVLLLEAAVFGYNNATYSAVYAHNNTALNTVRAQLVYKRNSESHPCELAAATAALRANTEYTGQVPDYDGSNGKGILKNCAITRVGSEADLFTDTETNLLLNNGVTPLADFGGYLAMVRGITSYCHLGGSYTVAGGGAGDYRAIDVGDQSVTDWICLDVQLFYQTVFRVANPYVGPDPDEGEPDPPSGTAHPSLWNSELKFKLKQYFDDNQIEDPSLNEPESSFNETAHRIQSELTVVVRRVQHQIGVIVRQKQTA